MSQNSNLYEKRAVSLGGYGSLVPYHGPLTYDPATPGAAREIPIPMDQAKPEDVVERLDEVAKHLRVRTEPGQLFYSLHWSDYGWHSSGLTQLEEDLENPFDVGEELKATLEDQYGRELRTHRPCFTIVAPAEYGLFWMMLRGGKRYENEDQNEWETVYYAKCGVLIDQPVLSWPNLEEFIENDGGPITQNATDVKTASFRNDEQEISGVYPLDQAGTGDADIVAGQNIANAEGLDTRDEDLTEAVERTSHLTYRVNGGTVGFDKEQAFTVKSFSLYQPEEITLWGHPFVICMPMCNAYEDT